MFCVFYQEIKAEMNEFTEKNAEDSKRQETDKEIDKETDMRHIKKIGRDKRQTKRQTLSTYVSI